MNNNKHTRFQIIKAFFIASALLLVGALIKIQLLDQFYSSKANATTLIQNTIYPARGLFYDRNGKLLVINYPTYDLLATYKDISPTMDTQLFCSILKIDQEKFISGLQKDWSSGKYSKSIPFVFLKNINPEYILAFQENLYRYPGFQAQLRSIRVYPQDHGANFLGYISEVSRDEIDNSLGEYKIGDYSGTNGLEMEYEQVVKGEKGVHFVLKDNLGRPVGPYEEGRLDRMAVSGTDIKITIDLELQKFCDSLMKNKTGSIVAIEPSSGEILCLNTSPTYNPNFLAIHSDRGKAYAMLMRDSLKPLFDRSASAKYPPGSIFKPILALIALQENSLNPNTSHKCSGAYYYKTVSYGCHHHPAPYKLSVALQHSCNSYFIQTFRDLVDKEGFSKPEIGLNILVDYLSEFGLGKPLLSDVNNENSGFIPTSDYYTRLYKTDKWRSTYILSIAIGQGELQLTTLQMANLAAILANRGYYYTPHLVKQFINNQFAIPTEFTKAKRVSIDTKYFEPVIEGMQLAVSSGTATQAYFEQISICGKTGTSQNPHGEDHSVFFAFAPKYNPKIAIAVYVENAGWGGSVAAPIASLIIEKYINGTVSRQALKEKMIQKNIIRKIKA